MNVIAKRVFNNVEVSIYVTPSGIYQAKVTNGWYANYGSIYLYALNQYIGGNTTVQVFGFETSNGLNKTVLHWLHNTVVRLVKKNLIVL